MHLLFDYWQLIYMYMFNIKWWLMISQTNYSMNWLIAWHHTCITGEWMQLTMIRLFISYFNACTCRTNNNVQLIISYSNACNCLTIHNDNCLTIYDVRLIISYFNACDHIAWRLYNNGLIIWLFLMHENK